MAKNLQRFIHLIAAAACVCGLVATPAGALVDTQGRPPMRQWLPPQPPKIAMLCLHGLGLHAGSFDDFGQRMSRDGVAVYAIDVRGFGNWYLRNESKIDFDATMRDIANVRELIAREHPGVPIFIVGESMGGAVALQAASKFPDKFDGLICAVPSGDRFGDLNVDLHIGLKVLTKGFGERFDAGNAVIKHATKNEEHRYKWAHDPLARKDYSVGELLTFQTFMNKNKAAAEQLKTVPVLFVQGAHDTLVRPSGTWDVFGYLQSPMRDKVISESAEHLIFENGQFKPNDIKYIDEWMVRALKSKVATAPPAVHNTEEGLAQADPALNAPSVIKSVANLAYWIELKRDGKTFRCTNKTAFRSGDEIRFHVRSGVDGYAYIVLQQGSGGGRAVLFPDARTGTNNAVSANDDTAIPTRTYLRFDDKPGLEKLNLVFSKRPINGGDSNAAILTAYVSPDRTGAKDLVPTRMQLSWDDADTGTALVRVTSPEDTIALDIALEHK